MRSFRIYIFMALAAVLFSCSKESLPQEDGSDFISFHIIDKNFGGQETKAIVEDTQKLFDLKLQLRVCDLAGINGGTEDIKDKAVNYNTSYNLWRSDIQWNDSRNYEFYGYMLSPGTGANASVSLVSGYQGNPGHSVNIYQPTAYAHDDAAWSDYLLSYRVSAQGKNKPLVRMEMERITSGVELYISTPKGAQAVVESMTFTDITRSNRYTIAEHAISNPNLTGIRNKWVYQTISGVSNPVVTYTRSANSADDWFSVAEKSEGDSRFDSKFRMMRFITVPQNVTGTLTLIYRVNETNDSDRNNWTRYTASFNLAETAVTRWELGRKTRYYISLDTAVELEGVIGEWVDIDYVEGTFLPK